MIHIAANILVVEDSIAQAKMLQMILEAERHTVFVSYDGSNILNILSENCIDIVLLDIILPQNDGFELLKIIMEHEETSEVPVIMLTGLTEGKDVKKALDMGAFDYIKKPIDSLEVVARVQSAVRLKIKQDELKEYAVRDALTKLNNRAHCDQVLPKLIKSRTSYTKGISLAMLDCDFFKRINDTYGHVSGDVVLSTVANAIKKSIKSTDFAWRYGGEEFCIALINTSLQEGFIICERLRVNIGKIKFIFDGREVSMTVSIGLSHSRLDEEITGLEFIDEADQALYQAKRKGRNRVEFLKK